MNENERCLLIGAVLAVIALSTILDLPPYTWIDRAIDRAFCVVVRVRGLVAAYIASSHAMGPALETVDDAVAGDELPSDRGV